MNSPCTLVLQTVLGFRSPPTVTLQTHVSTILPTLNELALNCIGIPILGFKTIVSGTTAQTNFISSSFGSPPSAPYETTEASLLAVPDFLVGESELFASALVLFKFFLSILVVLTHWIFICFLPLFSRKNSLVQLLWVYYVPKSIVFKLSLQYKVEPTPLALSATSKSTPLLTITCKVSWNF